MIGTCGTCKWYNLDEYGLKFDKHCGRWHVGYGVDPKDVKENEAWVENDEGWAMQLGPKFGCVLHEPVTSDSI